MWCGFWTHTPPSVDLGVLHLKFVTKCVALYSPRESKGLIFLVFPNPDMYPANMVLVTSSYITNLCNAGGFIKPCVSLSLPEGYACIDNNI